MASMGLVYEILQTLVEGVAIENSSGRVAFANTSLERLLGYQQGELLGAHWKSLFHVSSQLTRQEGGTGESVQSAGRHRAALLHRNGKEIPVQVSSRRLPAGDGEEVILSTFSLAQESQAQEAECSQKKEIDVASQQGSTFVHELNNSLAIIVLQSRLLAGRGPLSRQYGMGLSVIHDQAQRMMQMVDSLRFSKDPLLPRLETVEVNALLKQTAEIQRVQFLRDGMELATNLAADLPLTQADPHQLQQVFVNLINNARQAMTSARQGRRLVISSVLGRDVGATSSTIQIRFADNGPGIPADLKHRIFEPFFTTKNDDRGMGLGLSICSQIAQKHNGTIWAEDNGEGGATFVLELPVVTKEPGSDTLTPARREKRTNQPRQGSHLVCGKHILVVDDEVAVAHAMQLALQQAGFQVSTASEAQQALSLVDGTRIDLIVSDLSMPQMSGQEFWETVIDRHPHLVGRVIFATGDSRSKKASAFLQNCGCTWIEKPFRLDELVCLIGEVLPDE